MIFFSREHTWTKYSSTSISSLGVSVQNSRFLEESDQHTWSQRSIPGLFLGRPKDAA